MSDARIINPFISTGPIAKSYSSAHVIAQVSVSKATTSQFTVVINARHTYTTIFSKEVRVANNVRVAAVKHGTVQQKGNQVKIQVQNEQEAKSIIIDIQGTMSNDIFIAPNIDTMTFS